MLIWYTLGHSDRLFHSYASAAYTQWLNETFNKIQTQKGSNERLFILTQTHSL